jgi:hypothetical protein
MLSSKDPEWFGAELPGTLNKEDGTMFMVFWFLAYRFFL